MIILKELTIQNQYNDIGNVIDYFDFNRHFSKNIPSDISKASSAYVPLVPDKTVLVPVKTNEITVLSSHQKVNHAPTADFNYNLNIGQLTLESTSTDPDDDPLSHRWTITDDIVFRDKNVVYNFKRPGSHTVTLTVSDGELSDTKSVTVVSTNDENTVNDYIIPDFTIAQNGSDFTCTDTSETYNVYQYTREWYLDGVLQSGTSETIEFNLNDKKKTGSIPCNKLALIYRSLGAFVPDEDLDEFIGNKREIKFEKFLNFFAEYYTKKIEKQQIIMGLSFLDENNDGNISASDLKHALTSIGEK